MDSLTVTSGHQMKSQVGPPQWPREWERVEIEFGVKVSSSKVVARREGVSLIKRLEGFHIQILTDGCDGLEGRGSNGACSSNEGLRALFIMAGLSIARALITVI